MKLLLSMSVAFALTACAIEQEVTTTTDYSGEWNITAGCVTSASVRPELFTGVVEIKKISKSQYTGTYTNMLGDIGRVNAEANDTTLSGDVAWPNGQNLSIIMSRVSDNLLKGLSSNQCAVTATR